MDGDRESPTSSPAPNQQDLAPVQELGHEAEAFPSPAPLELPHAYRYLSPEPSPAPSHSGLEGDYDLINSHPEASLSSVQGVTGCGAPNLRESTGGAANGTAWNERNKVPVPVFLK